MKRLYTVNIIYNNSSMLIHGMTISGLGVGIGRGASRLWFKQHSLLAVLTPDLMREEGCLGALCFVLVLGFGCGELLCFGVVLWFGLLGGALCFVGLKGWFVRRVEKWC